MISVNMMTPPTSPLLSRQGCTAHCIHIMRPLLRVIFSSGTDSE